MGRLHCTLIQADLHWEDKEKNLLQLEQMLNNKSPQELVILPEMFNTGFSMRPEVLAETMEGETVQWMRRMASRHRIILAGSLIIQENNQYYNRLIWMQPDGAMATYDKRHRFLAVVQAALDVIFGLCPTIKHDGEESLRAGVFA